MENSKIMIEPQKELFSKYPREMDNYFVNKNVTISLISLEFLQELAIDDNIIISSAEQYYDLLKTELDFWNENDKKNNLKDFHKKENLNSAMNLFNNALKNYESNNVNQGNSFLDQSLLVLKHGILYSKTTLAVFVLQYVDKSNYFLNGLKGGLLIDRNSSYSSTVATMEGLRIALDYIGNKCVIEDNIDIQYEELRNLVNSTNQKFTELNEKYRNVYYLHY